MYYSSAECEEKALLDAAFALCAAARTAPKGRGRDFILTAVVTGQEKEALARATERLGERYDAPIFLRDGGSIRKSGAVVLIGVARNRRGQKHCGMCGREDCAAAEKAGCRCAFNDLDLGVASGSAAALASDLRIDNRIMYTGGLGAMELGLLGEGVENIMALPLSVGGKNIFFDRTAK